MQKKIYGKSCKTGILGGSFDPIHFGHINLAIQMYEKKFLDKIILCPNNVSPHKVNRPPLASAKDRLHMVKIAVKDIDFIFVEEEEINRKGVSFTVDTLTNLKKKYPKDLFNLIISNEVLKDFESWKNYKEILEMAILLVGMKFFEKDISSIKKQIVDIKTLEISSTEIRERLKKRLPCNHLVPKEVLDYIKANKLYY